MRWNSPGEMDQALHCRDEVRPPLCADHRVDLVKDDRGDPGEQARAASWN